MQEAIEISKLIPWVGSGFVAIVVATFTLTKILSKSHIEALLQRITAKDEKIDELQRAIDAQEKEGFQNYKRELVLPPTTSERLPGELRNQYEQKRKELYDVVVIIQNSTENLFDPNSEMGNLAQMLKCEDIKTRKQGAKGLFELGDKTTLGLLSIYFFAHQKEATEAYLPCITEWLRHFHSLDRDSAISFCINLLKSGDDFNAQVAYEWLTSSVLGYKYRYEDIEPYFQELKGIALSEHNALRRTWVKLLIELYDSMKDKPVESCDQRSIFRILMDIEEYLKENFPKKEN